MAPANSLYIPFNASIPLVNMKVAQYGLLQKDASDTPNPETAIGVAISFRAVSGQSVEVAPSVQNATVYSLVAACAPPSTSQQLKVTCGPDAKKFGVTCEPYATDATGGYNIGAYAQIKKGSAYVDIAVNPSFKNSSLAVCLSNYAGVTLQNEINNAEFAKPDSSVISSAQKGIATRSLTLLALMTGACLVLGKI